MVNNSDRRKQKANAEKPPSDEKQRQLMRCSQINTALNSLGIESVMSRLTEEECPRSTPQVELSMPATTEWRVEIRRRDEMISESVETIKEQMLEALNQLNLPTKVKTELRRDLGSPKPYLEPEGIFLAPEDCHNSARNKGRLDRLMKLKAALPKQTAPILDASTVISVDVRRRVVTFHGKEETITVKQAVFIRLLVEANGGAVGSPQVLKALRADPCVPEEEKYEFRAGREIDRLPKALKETIGRGAGKGSWIRMEKLQPPV